VAAARAVGLRGAGLRAAAALDAACARLDQAREEAAASLALHAVQLAVEIAQTLVRAEVSAGRHDLEAIVREALAASGVGRGDCVVHLNPLDAAAVADVRFRAGTRIEADEAVRRGDVQVSTPHGLLVREIPEALRSIHERLLGELS
jgi:flagellar biosynthesis/type III secretory pathway protein FliH